MRLHKIAVAVAALSFAGVAAAAGNTTAGSTTNPSSNDQMTTRQTSPQSTQKSEQSTNQAGSSQMGNSSSMSQGGSSSEQTNPTEVKSAQQALKDKGFDVGTVDGQMGPNTESALRQFQQKQRLPQTGNLDEQTLSALGVDQNQGATSGQGSQNSTSHGASTQSSNTYK
jgi:peptidoglycan hydrolase-like protein with peptidoglycan-binding domain